jgi:ACS family hexuronate transporter-like MFS transporter
MGMSMPQQAPAAIGPILTEALHLTRAELGLLTTAIWGGMLLGMIPFGVLIDRKGERTMIALGAAVMAGFLLLASMMGSFFPIFLLLLPAAVGAASASPGGTRAIAAWFPRYERGLAMGIRQTGVTVAGILSALLLPPIAAGMGWPAVFRAVAVIALLSALVFAVFYREPGGRERPVSSPVDVRRLLTNGGLLRGTAFAWTSMGALGAAVSYLTVTLNQAQRLAPVLAGVYLGVLQLGGVLGRVGWGMLSDRLGSRGRTMTMTGAVSVLSCLGMALVAHQPLPAALLAPVILVVGLSTMGWNALYITLCAEIGPADRAATVVALGTTITFTGMVILTPLFGLIADRAGSFSLSWLCLAALLLSATVIAGGIRDRTATVPPMRAPAAL